VELIGRLTASASRGFPAISVVVGAGHACAIMPAGEAYCWGSNIAGQLGAGGTDRTPQPYPVRVAGGFTFTVLAAGGFHTCGLTAAGEAYCWGQNNSGQVGSDLPIATTPTRVAGAERFTALAAGMFHTCGLTIGRTVVCWGDNSVGQRGDGGNRSIAAPLGGSPLALPAPIAGGRSFVALAAGFYATCAVATTGETYCWGSNVRRELGTVAGTCRMRGDSFYYPEDYDWPCSTTPVPIDSRAALSSLTASGFATCGVTPVGDLVCWGDPFPPTTIPGARVSAAWSLGGSVCGLEGGEAVSCWGMWSGGVPIAPPFGHEIALVNLSTGGASSCGLSREQPAIVYCWGSNGQGQLGNGTTAESPLTAPVRLPRRNR
jgi:hypothetical protein